MSHYGIRGLPLKLLYSYLSERQQYIECIDGISSLEYITCGVPQGSTLGPLLFLIYINDLPAATSLDSTLFADDTALIDSAACCEELQISINKKIEMVNLWLKSNKLSLNPSKTKFMVFGSRQTNWQFHLQIDNKKIERAKCIEYLGIILDENLSWKPHIDHLCKKVSQSLGILYKLRRILGIDAIKIVYYSLIYSHLKYGNISWAGTNKTTLKPLVILHNKAIRCMLSAESQHSSNSLLYKQCGVLQLKDIYRSEIAKFMYRFENHMLPPIFHNFFTKISTIHSHATRSVTKRTYFMPRCSFSLTKKNARNRRHSNLGKNSV